MISHFAFFVQVGVKADAPVGIWKCKVETSLTIADRAADKALYTHPEPVYILFNPYSECKLALISADFCGM